MQDNVWIKTNDLIKEKYGKTLSYRAMKLISEASSSTNAADIYYSKGDDLVIPLKSKNHNLGDVIVDRGSLLDSQQKTEIVDLIKFLVEPKLYNLQLQKTEEILNNKSTQGLRIVQDEVVRLYHQTAEEKHQTLSQIILLKSHTELTRHRVALKIHEMTERHLFVRLSDIMSSTSSKADFESLSDVTIYIEDVEKLDLKTLSLLQDYLEQSNVNGPLFLVGSSLTMESILDQKWPEGLKKDLAGFYFDIDRVPMSQQTSTEVLDLLFFQFDSTLI